MAHLSSWSLTAAGRQVLKVLQLSSPLQGCPTPGPHRLNAISIKFQTIVFIWEPDKLNLKFLCKWLIFYILPWREEQREGDRGSQGLDCGPSGRARASWREFSRISWWMDGWWGVRKSRGALRLSEKHDNCLLCHGLSSDGLGGPWRFQGSQNGFAGDMVVGDPVSLVVLQQWCCP